MEIHHHSHTADSGPHRGKKWMHYFWEFLMLFLAVFCGFLAEYQLEHRIEKDRERQYIKGMLEDLASDTVMIGSTIEFATQISNGLDSLQSNLFDTDSTIAKTLTIYRQNFTYIRLIVVSFSDQTATQLRNSGALRLIRKREIANEISRYWQGINSVDHITDYLETQFNEISEAGFNLFNRMHIIRISNPAIRPNDTIVQEDSKIRAADKIALSNYSRQRLYFPIIHENARLLTTDKFVLINYANRLNRTAASIRGFLLVRLDIQNKRAAKLISLIKEEYNLK